MREYFRQPDQLPTVTVLISAPVTVAGQTWRCTVPLLGMTFDQRTDQDALISAVIAAAFGDADIPAGVTCRLLANASKADYASGFDARQTPLGSICFELQFSADFVGMTDVPLVFTVAGLATDAPANSDIALPVIAPNTTDLTLRDFQGGTLPGGFYSEPEIPSALPPSGEAGGERLEWQLPGTLPNGASFKKRIHGARTLKWFKCDALTAPSADVELQILKNGVSVFTTAPNPVLEAGLTYVETNGFDTGAELCVANDVFQLVVESSTGAANVNITLYFE